MPTRRCCCPDCLICRDDFNRENENPVTDWVEKSGDWAIADQTLVAVADGVLLTACRQSLPVGTTYNYQVVVDLLDTSASWGIICKYIDASNYDWIEITTTGVNIRPVFWRRTGGADTLIMDITTHPAGVSLSTSMPTALRVTICYAETEWSIVSATPLGTASWSTCNVTAATALPADTTVGFVGFSKGDFDDWEYYYHDLSKPLCARCTCFCTNPADPTDYKCIPETLTLTLTPIVAEPDCTSSPATWTYTLRQSVPLSNVPPPATYTASPFKRYWYSDPVQLYEPLYMNKYFWFRLECVGDGVFELSLLDYDGSGPVAANWINFDVVGGPVNGASVTPNTALACTPIVLTFSTFVKFVSQFTTGGPFLCDPFDAKEYSAVVTE